jgi:hypothetical protein
MVYVKELLFSPSKANWFLTQRVENPSTNILRKDRKKYLPAYRYLAIIFIASQQE